jgi:hypothetical protein
MALAVPLVGRAGKRLHPLPEDPEERGPVGEGAVTLTFLRRHRHERSHNLSHRRAFAIRTAHRSGVVVLDAQLYRKGLVTITTLIVISWHPLTLLVCVSLYMFTPAVVPDYS